MWEEDFDHGYPGENFHWLFRLSQVSITSHSALSDKSTDKSIHPESQKPRDPIISQKLQLWTPLLWETGMNLNT